MPGTVSTEIVYDSTFFNPVQLQARAVLSAGFTSWARWTADHLASFPQLLSKHGTSFVVTAVRLDWPVPFGFLDGDRVTLTTGARTDPTGNHLRVVSDVTAGGTTVARAEVHARCVRLDPDGGFGARPGPIPDALLDRLPADERTAAVPRRLLPAALRRLAEQSPALATGTHEVVLHRGLCEVADQWAFTEIPAQLGAAREALAAARGGDVPALRAGLRAPVRRLDLELRRPFFLLDTMTVETSAHTDGAATVFAHRITGRDGRLHGLARESLVPA